MCKQLLVLFLFSAWSICATAQKDKNEMGTHLWQISGNGLLRPSYLFGSLHLICTKDIKPKKNVVEAMRSVDTVYLEALLHDSLGKSRGRIYLKDGKSLKDIMPANEFNETMEFFVSNLQVNMTEYQYLHPIVLEYFLYAMFAECSSMTSVEEVVSQTAKNLGKPIAGIVSIDEHYASLDSIPLSKQAGWLYWKIHNYKKARSMFKKGYKAYLRQEEPEAQNTSDKYINDFIIDNRNLRWVNKLEPAMKKNAFFLTVGFMHLGGERGLINLFRQKGYTLTPMR